MFSCFYLKCSTFFILFINIFDVPVNILFIINILIYEIETLQDFYKLQVEQIIFVLIYKGCM